MRRVAPVVAVVSVAMACATTSAFGDLVVDSWYLESAISSSFGQSFEWSDSVQNPYQETLTGAQGDSFSRADHDFAWDAHTAHFDVDITHHGQQFEGYIFTDGRIHLVPSVDSTITAWGTWQYAWPDSAEGSTAIQFHISDVDTKEPVAMGFASGGNVDPFEPPYGTLNIADSGVLLAGRQYQLYYIARLTYLTSVPSGDAFGEFHFAIDPVPEPATLAFLLAVALIRRRRRR